MHVEEMETTLVSRLAPVLFVVGAIFIPVFLVVEGCMSLWKLARGVPSTRP